MESHLLIGLGGTGGRVLSAFRKIIHEKLHGEMNPEWLWLDYMYVDSSSKDLKMEDPAQWTVMGESIRLDESSLVRIPASNLSQFVDNKNRYKYLAPWIGDVNQWTNIVRDEKIQEGAAGQKRRLGRLLFANGAPQFNRILGNKVDSKLKLNPNGQKVNFHIIAGLAGGTGSGSIVDAVAQIRNAYTDTNNYKIYLYLLLPEEGQTDWATTDNYRPNGYAALSELNALEMKAFNPWNLGERNYEVTRMQLNLPFYSAYLITNENSRNVSFDVKKTVPASIAEFIFQKTVALSINENQLHNGEGQTQDICDFFDRAERGENPKYTEYDQLQSFNFMTYGIKRLAIPEVEIREYFSYNFAAQALNQLLYNNLTKELGYVGEAKTLTEDDYSIVIDRKNRDKWLITRPYLMLSLPILPEHKKENWASLQEEFNTLVKKTVNKVRENKEIKHNDKFIAIHNLVKRFYDKDFRPIREEGQNGVVNFYNDKLKYGKQAMAEFITEKIGSEFFNLWINGDYSLQQLSALTGRLIQSLEEEKDSLKIAKSQANENVAKANWRIPEVQKQWSNLGVIEKLRLGSSMNKIEEEYAKLITDKFLFMAFGVAYEFAIELIDSIINLLIVQKSNIDQVNTEFKTVTEDIEGCINNRCTTETEDEQSRQGMIIKYYNVDKVKSICANAIKLDSNESRVREIRVNLANILSSEKQNFKEAADKLHAGNIKEKVEKIVIRQTEDFFTDENQTKNIPNFEPLLGVNIVEKLRDEFSGNEQGLKRKLERLVQHAAVMAKENPAEIHDGPTKRKSMFIILPKYEQDQQFLNLLKQTIQSLAPADGEIPKISEGGASNEIIVMNLEANITPRYLLLVERLRKSYDSLLNSEKGEVASFETRLEDYENPLPSLFNLSDKELQEKQQEKEREALSLPYLLLAKAMGVLSLQEDPETGLEKLMYIPLDEDGIPDTENIVVLGRTLEKSIEKLDSKIIDILYTTVNEKLMSEYRHVAKQAQLKEKIVEDVKNITEKNGPLSKVSKDFSMAFKLIKDKFEKMNDM